MARRVMETVQAEVVKGDFRHSVKVRILLQNINFDYQLNVDLKDTFVFQEYSKCLEDLYKYVRHPFKGLVTAEQLYWKALRLVHGNRMYLE